MLLTKQNHQQRSEAKHEAGEDRSYHKKEMAMDWTHSKGANNQHYTAVPITSGILKGKGRGNGQRNFGGEQLRRNTKGWA